MAGIETGGVSAQSETRVNPFDNKEGKQTGSQEKAAAPAKGDSVTLDNFIDKLINKLNSFFAGNKMAKEQFSQTITELSIRANVQQTFESQTQVSADGAKISAYSKQTTSVDIQISYREQQAQQVVDAQAAALEENPFSPEATAKRITDFALKFFPMYASQHQDMTYEQQVDGYKKLVSGAIDQGFTEAMKILGDMPSQVSEGISKTRDIVTQNLNSFFDYMLGKGAEGAKKAMDKGGDWQGFVKDFFSAEKAENPVTEKKETSEESSKSQEA